MNRLRSRLGTKRLGSCLWAAGALALLVFAGGCAGSSHQDVPKELHDSLAIYLRQELLWEAQPGLRPNLDEFLRELASTLESVHDEKSAEAAHDSLDLLFTRLDVLGPHQVGPALRPAGEAQQELASLDVWLRLQADLRRLDRHPRQEEILESSLTELNQKVQALS